MFPDTQVNLLYPLDEFYARAGRPLPSIERLDGPDVPEPFRSLLVHDRDMTPTMAAAHEGTVGLRVLEHWFGGDAYSRLIVLTATGRPVLFGAIKIYLHRFPNEARALVLEDRLPFGTILQVSAITHASRPLAFFRAASDVFINSALGLDGSLLLHGRRNVLSNARGEPLAQVFEILAPR